jgi:membrane protein DedA with SNARE-associated domain
MSAIEQITALIHAHSSFAGPLCLVVAFLGCLLGTNLIVPAGAILTALGVLIGAGVLSWTIVPWAACGASAGMSVSYTLGLRLGSRVQRIPLLRRRPAFMAGARRLFERYGFASILIGYFSGPLRAPVASTAAIAGMQRGQFELANVVSALVWTIVAVGIGAIPGTMIGPNSIWLLVGPLLVPVITIAISSAILLLWSARSP